jgi:hypothetical protein
MEDDLIAGLTRQVKQEVIENYITERRLIALQIEDIETQASDVRFQALKTGRRLDRLVQLMFGTDKMERLLKALSIPTSSYWAGCLGKQFPKGIRLIRVRAFTDRSRFRKLVLEAYSRLYRWMEKYRESYEDLKGNCAAVNTNIASFQKNFDLLAILNFIKSLDTQQIDKKVFLGENFTPEEVTSLDKKLHMGPIGFEKLDVPEPLSLANPASIEPILENLANEVYVKYETRIKNILR